MNNRTGSILLAAGMAVVMAAGCSDRTVDYDLETQISGSEGTGSIRQFAEAEDWNEKWIATGADGEEWELSVRTPVTVPDTDSMSVIEVEETVVDGDYKKQLLSGLFGNSEVYYHDPEYYTREELQAAIDEQQQLIDGAYDQMDAAQDKSDEYQQSVNNHMTEWIERYEEDKKKYEDLMETAKEEYTVAADYDICNNYLGYAGDMLLEVSFEYLEDGTQSVWCIRADYAGEDYIGPESLKDYQNVNQIEMSMGALMMEADGISNECVYTMEEARELADRFLSGIGNDGMVCTEQADALWTASSQDEGGVITATGEAAYGYMFSYSMAPDGQTLAESMFRYDTVSAMETFPDRFYDSNCIMNLQVQDEGITSFYMYAPITINQISRPVELLPLDSIQRIMQNELEENASAYDFGDLPKLFNSLELIYFRVKDDEKLGSYSYVPTWRLCYQYQQSEEYCHAVLVNAIDGTVIHIQDEL